MGRFAYFLGFLIVSSVLSAQTVESESYFSPDSLSREAREFRKEIRLGRLPLVLSEEEKAWMDEILFHEQDSLERVERAAEIKRAGEKEEGSRSGTTYSVGAIPLEQGVSPSGARTYSIPIPTGPGFKLVPSVALAYNSQSAEGWAGYGWDIQCISTISLINHNEYYHGCIKAACDTASSPVFALDGMPLLANDDTLTCADYPLATATGHVLARAVLNSNGYVGYFEVLYPNGCRATFGRTSYSGDSNLLFYKIRRMDDHLGNRISFVYSTQESSGDDRLSSIRYGYDSSGYSSGVINFTYTACDSPTVRYFAGKSTQRTHKLHEIKSSVNGELLYGYTLSYIQQDNVYLLSQVDCGNGSGEQLPPVTFTYGTVPTAQCLTKDPSGISLPDSLYRPDIIPYAYKRGKFLSGIFDDGVFIHLNQQYYICHPIFVLHPQQYYFESGIPAGSNVLLIPRFANNSNYDTSIKAEEGFQTIEAVDVNGDGVDELVKVNLSVSSTLDSTRLVLKVYKCNSSGGADLLYTKAPILPGIVLQGFPNPYYMAYFWGDFRGNGHTMLLTIAYKDLPNYSYATQTCYASIIDIETGEVLSSDVLFDLMDGDAKTVLVCDLDADGRAELCHASGTGFDIYRLQSSGHFALEKHLGYPGATTFTDNDRDFYITDLNGDGYMDIVRTPLAGTTGSEWLYFKYDGSYFVPGGASITTRQAGDKFMFMDVNHDGLADLIRISGTTLSTFINLDGTNFGAAQVSPSTISGANGIVQANVVTRKGMSAFMKFDGSTGFGYKYSPVSPKLRHVKRVNDGFGKTFANTYDYLPNRSSSWTDGAYSPTSSAGYSKRALPLYVLTDEYTYEGNYGLPSLFIQHNYYDPVVHNRGLGFCGFHKLYSRQIHYFLVGHIARSGVKGSQTTIFDPEKRGVATSISSSSVSGSASFRTIVNTWDNHTTSQGILSPRLTTSVDTDTRTGVTTTSFFTYDEFDFPTRIVTERESVDSYKKETVSRTYAHSDTSALYLLGSVAEECLDRGSGVSPMQLWRNRSEWSLDTLFRPIEKREYRGVATRRIYPPGNTPGVLPNAPDYVGGSLLVRTTRCTYDSSGNVASECSAPYDATEFLGDTLVYDSAGRFLLSKTDALGHTTTYSGYNKYGSPASATDYRGRTKSFTYDAWGNLLQTSYADGSVETTSREWTDGTWSSGTYGCGGRSFVAVTTTCTGKPSTVVHYDAFGREVHSGDQRFDGSWRWTDRQYDFDGLLLKVSVPYKTATATATSPAASLWNTYTYDSFDRVTSIEEASGRETTWSYSGTSTTTVKDGITSTSTKDASGNIVSVTDAGGTITYTLRDDGQPASVTAPGDVVTTFSYDGYGRRIGMDDPSVGTRTYSYTWNADGSSSSSQTGPNGTITTSKDKYGRTTSVVREGEGAITTAYTYDNYGRLASEASTNGTSTTYAYDTLDRVASIREDIPDGKWLKRDYSYGAGSNVASVLYTSKTDTITTEHYSYAYGHNKEILLPDSSVVFRLQAENELGQPHWIKTGAVSRQYRFDAYGLPTQRRMVVGAGGPLTTLQDFSYAFDAATGNLSARSDDLNGTDETLEYDSLWRLVQAATTVRRAVTSRSFTFEDNGNFTHHSGVGFINYDDPGSPYKATSLTNPAYITTLIPKQDITYNAYDRPTSISQDGITASLTYNGAEDRVRMAVVDSTGAVPATLLTRYYLGGRYEIDIAPAGSGGGATTTERFYLGGDAYSAPMVLVRTGGSGAWTTYNIGRDYLGSITHIITASGSPVAEYSYEPWGRQRNPADLIIYYAGSEPELFLGRGYTGHEYLPWFRLYNMNARLYDPLVGRFLAPDPFVQAPDFTQNFNRYSYCLNNPLKYSDEDGESIVLAATLLAVGIIAVVHGLGNVAAHAVRNDDLGHGNWAKYYFSGFLSGLTAPIMSSVGSIWFAATTSRTPGQFFRHYFYSRMSWMYPALTEFNFLASAYNGVVNHNDQWFNNFAKTALGPFYLDENKSFWGQVWEGVSRNTLESPQQVMGYAWSSIRNAWSERVDLWGGATFTTNFNGSYGPGVTIGSFVNIDSNYTDGNINKYSSFDTFMKSGEYMAEEYYQHEYGHTIQSKKFGPLYLPIPALQSLLVTSFTNRADAFWTEKQADSFGLYYINSVKGIRRPRITTL